eukprot:jgi/Mesvir1/26863/Mv20607-RA.2
MDTDGEFSLLEHLGVVIPQEAAKLPASNGASGEIRVYKPRMSAPSPHRRSERDLLPNNNLFCKTSVANGEAVASTARVLFAHDAPRAAEATRDDGSTFGDSAEDHRASALTSRGQYNNVAGPNRDDGSITTAAATRATSTPSSSAVSSYKDEYRTTKFSHFVAGEPTVDVASPTFRFLVDKGRERAGLGADKGPQQAAGAGRPQSAGGDLNRSSRGGHGHGDGDAGGDGFATPSSATCRHGVKNGGLICDLCINGALVKEKAERLRAEHQRRVEEARRVEAAIAAEQKEYTRRVEERRAQMRATVQEGLQKQLATRASSSSQADFGVASKPHGGGDRPKPAAAPVEWSPEEEARLAEWAEKAERALAEEIAAHNAEMERRKREYGQALREQIQQQRELQQRQRRQEEQHPLGDSHSGAGLKLLSQREGRDDAPPQLTTQRELLARWAQARAEYRAQLEEQIVLRAKAKQEERRAEKEASLRRAAEQEAAVAMLEQQMQHHQKEKTQAFGQELRQQILAREEEARRQREEDRNLPQIYDEMSRAEKERVMQRWRQQREEEQAYAAALRAQILERRNHRERERKEGQLIYRRWCTQAVADQAGTLAETSRGGAILVNPQGPAAPYTNAFVAETGVGQIQRLAAGGTSGGGRALGPRIGPMPPQAESGVFAFQGDFDNGAGGKAYDFCSACHRKMPITRLSPWTPKRSAHECTNTVGGVRGIVRI